MKKIILSFSLLLLVGAASAFANDEKSINENAKKSFANDFAGAQFVNWVQSHEFTKATFVLGGHRAEAYFNTDGELTACVRDLFYDQLPLNVMTAFDKRYGAAEVMDVQEVTTSESTYYRVTLQDKDRKVRVKLDSNGNFLETSRIKK